jgi:hypothetical protein
MFTSKVCNDTRFIFCDQTNRQRSEVPNILRWDPLGARPPEVHLYTEMFDLLSGHLADEPHEEGAYSRLKSEVTVRTIGLIHKGVSTPLGTCYAGLPSTISASFSGG